MSTNERKSLTDHVDRIVALNAQIADAKWEIQEVAQAAFDKGLVRTENLATARKVVKQLAKDKAQDAAEREKQRSYEELLDECRASLGLLADTPLGEAAQAAHANGAANGAEPVSERSSASTKRGPGRPKGSKNKPKPASDEWSRPPPVNTAPEPPAVPDLDDSA